VAGGEEYSHRVVFLSRGVLCLGVPPQLDAIKAKKEAKKKAEAERREREAAEDKAACAAAGLGPVPTEISAAELEALPDAQFQECVSPPSARTRRMAPRGVSHGANGGVTTSGCSASPDQHPFRCWHLPACLPACLPSQVL
jgi:hypothetical protein